MALENSSLVRLDRDYEIKPFDCDDEDLNNFLFFDSKPALNQNLEKKIELAVDLSP